MGLLFVVLQVIALLCVLPLACTFVFLNSTSQLLSRVTRKPGKAPGKTVAITGGRSPFTLELARMFHKQGHKVVMIECMPFHLSRYSNSVDKSVLVSSPVQSHVNYFSGIGDTLRTERVDILIPTCEEIFHLAKAKTSIQKNAPNCCLFFEDIHTLRVLHNKWEFAEMVRKKREQVPGLLVPETRLVSSEEGLDAVLKSKEEVVLKPCYSRFAQSTVILPKIGDKRLEKVRASLRAGVKWVAQRYIHGKQLCTYSIAVEGKMVAHACYATEFTPGSQGATMVWESIQHPETERAIRALLLNLKITGQYAFDFIEQKDGSVFVIECNPRSTSGIHLFADQPQFLEAFLNPKQTSFDAPLHPRPNQIPRFVAGALLFFNYFSKTGPKNIKQLLRWLIVFTTSKDVIWDVTDPIPTIVQYISALQLVIVGLIHGINPIEATTLDIEWNGD